MIDSIKPTAARYRRWAVGEFGEEEGNARADEYDRECLRLARIPWKIVGIGILFGSAVYLLITLLQFTGVIPPA